jgi:hypothetical protein
MEGDYITHPKSNNEVRIVSLATHKTASCQGSGAAVLASPLICAPHGSIEHIPA